MMDRPSYRETTEETIESLKRGAPGWAGEPLRWLERVDAGSIELARVAADVQLLGVAARGWGESRLVREKNDAVLPEWFRDGITYLLTLPPEDRHLVRDRVAAQTDRLGRFLRNRCFIEVPGDGSDRRIDFLFPDEPIHEWTYKTRMPTNLTLRALADSHVVDDIRESAKHWYMFYRLLVDADIVLRTMESEDMEQLEEFRKAGLTQAPGSLPMWATAFLGQYTATWSDFWKRTELVGEVRGMIRLLCKEGIEEG